MGKTVRAAVKFPDTDIVIASAKAYLNALNKLHSSLEKVNPQGGV